jgi:hypothetical protein
VIRTKFRQTPQVPTAPPISPFDADATADTGSAAWNDWTHTIVLLLLILPILLVLSITLWRTPFAISETVALLEDMDQKSPWAFLALTDAYFRPVFYLTLQAIWHIAGDTGLALTSYKVLHISTVLLTVILFAWHLRPRTIMDAAAGTFAVAVLIASPSFRQNLENLPLNQMMVIMLIATLTWHLAERRHLMWHGPLLMLLTVIATGFKEQGLLVGVLVVAAYLTGAPGVNRRTAVAAAGFTVVYVLVRSAIGLEAWPPMQSVGYGFSEMTTTEAAARFPGISRYVLYAYNVLSTVGNVLLSEPTSGRFVVLRAFLSSNATPADVIALVSSLALSGCIGVAAWRALAQHPRGQWTKESRAYLAFGLTLAGSAAMGFSYTRDRFSGVAAVFYALAAYYMLRTLTTAVTWHPRRMASIASLILLLAGAWQVRSVGTIQYQRRTATQNRMEWLVDRTERQEAFADRPVYLRILEALTPQGVDPQWAPVGSDPKWFEQVFGSG